MPRAAPRLHRALALALSLAAALACAGLPPSPPTRPGPAIPDALAACPLRLTDAVLDDLQSYLTCPLPAPVAELVRNDYADDELGPPDLQALAAWSGKVPREKFLYQLQHWVDPEGSLLPWIRIDPDQLWPDPILAPDLAIRFSGQPPSTPIPESQPAPLQPPLDPAVPFWPARQAELRRSRTPSRPLGALRVAIDPGHSGRVLSRFERRHYEWTDPAGQRHSIQEGDLTYRTALELQRKLQAKGVEAFLTRGDGEAGQPHPPSHFRPFADALLRHLSQDPGFQQLEEPLSSEDRLRLRTAAALWAVRKQFIFETLRERMRRAAQRHPDLLVSIHYNARPVGSSAPGPTPLVAMITGDYQSTRLYNPFNRARALTEAFAIDRFDASTHLAAACLRRMSDLLQIPIVRDNPYPDHQPIPSASGAPTGVDAWNGAIFRYLDVPAVLTEGPTMDDPAEMLRLEAMLRQPLHAPGTTSERYAEAVAQGIAAYAVRWLAQERNDFGPPLLP
jgi:hypothetical protein